MSQVSFNTLYMGFPVKVVCGWDRPLQYYHFTIFDLRMDAEEECIYSCLDDNTIEIFQVKSLYLWKEKLKAYHIEVPDGFWERAERKEGNCIYEYSKGTWNR